MKGNAEVVSKNIIEIRDLKVEFPLPFSEVLFDNARTIKAVNKINLSIPKGKFFGLVGESGSGKTTLGKAVLKMVKTSKGEVIYDDGEHRFDVTALPKKSLKEYRKLAQLIFQDPYTSLNSRMTVRDIIAEPLEVMKLTRNKQETDEKVKKIAQKCRLNIEHLRRYPHAFSGGQRQRISIARALIALPKFIVADESVAALDLSIQADVINLLKQLQQEMGLTFLFISHDLSVVAYSCDIIAVMYLGQLVEILPSKGLFERATHPYTRALLEAVPTLSPINTARPKLKLKGEIPSSYKLPSGCKFHTRCPFVEDRCKREEPELRGNSEHLYACHLVEKITKKR